jgi:glutathione-specific gamma-glutamylcyclotransferase
MSPGQTVLSRCSIAAGEVERMVAATIDPDLVPLTEAERRRSLADILATAPAAEDVWIFGYGSLIWNPVVEFRERRSARVYGWHRRLCLMTRVARGTPACPGLMLGLVRGGSCAGVALRLAAAQREHELDLLWHLEMVDDAYRPVWVRAQTALGRIHAIAFVANPLHRRYALPMNDGDAARMVASARGQFGLCMEYVSNTVSHLRGMGISDVRLTRIGALAAEFASGGQSASPVENGR